VLPLRAYFVAPHPPAPDSSGAISVWVLGVWLWVKVEGFIRITVKLAQGVRVQGFRLRFQDSRFRVYSLGFRVQGLKRVKDLGVRF
jgi:hypothetical protein